MRASRCDYAWQGMDAALTQLAGKLSTFVFIRHPDSPAENDGAVPLIGQLQCTETSPRHNYMIPFTYSSPESR